MKLLRTIRFDHSDTYVYDTAAPEQEWAVSGAGAFAGLPGETLTGKTRQAFANGFLGIGSFGRSTFATVASITSEDLARIEAQLADHILSVYAAPSLAAAEEAARSDIAFVADLVRDAQINTVFTVRRTREESGEIRETFRTIRPPTGEPVHARIWTVEADDA
jgi:hypothetical protein